jgi:hypothetical protein
VVPRLVLFLLLIAAPVFGQHTDADGRAHSATFLDAWTSAPRGIPTPSFGITYVTDTPPTAATHCSGGASAESANCWYVDRTHGSATDTPGAGDSTPRKGYPDKPRLTVPTSVTAGGTTQLVRVAGSGYTFGGNVTWTATGASGSPVYIIAESGRPDFDGGASTRSISFACTYATIYGLKFTNITVNYAANADHCSIAYNELTGINASGGATVGYGTDTTDTVTYRNYGHDNGPTIPLAAEADHHFSKPSTSGGARSQNMWFIDNHVHNTSGDVYQCGSDPADADIVNWPHHLYIARNVGHTTGENAFDFKACRDIIVSENDMYDFRAAYAFADPGACLVTHGIDTSPVGSDPDSGRGSKNVWILFNRIHDCTEGISGVGQNNLYILGNLFYDINHEAADEPYSYTTGSENTGSIAHVRSHNGDHIFQHNTAYGNSRGYNCESNGDPCTFLDNIIASNTGASAAFGWEDSNNATSTMSHNLVSYGASGMTFGNFVSTYYATLATFNATATVDCTSCVENGADFVNAGSQDFRIQLTSDAIDAASDVRTYYDLFNTNYSISIKYDFAGNALPDSDADIGAYQFTPPGNSTRVPFLRR